jgi:hypothetical protein
MKCTDLIISFRDFISNSWENIKLFYENLDEEEKEIFLNDWLQANWEILVERSICETNEFLEVYGYGADCNGQSSRVIYPEILPTHKITCKVKNNELVKDFMTDKLIQIENVDFMGFVNFKNKYFEIAPPFDFILLSSDKDIVLSISDIEFYFEKMEPPR